MVPEQTGVGPEMVPGWEGIGVTETDLLLVALEPQPLLALTVMDPPEAPAVAVIEVLVELPVHPPGKVQV